MGISLMLSLKACTGKVLAASYVRCSKLTASISCSVATISWFWTCSINSALWAPFIPPEELEEEDEEKPKSDMLLSLLKIEDKRFLKRPQYHHMWDLRFFTWPSPPTFPGVPRYLAIWRVDTVLWSISAVLEVTVVAIVKVVALTTRMVNSHC